VSKKCLRNANNPEEPDHLIGETIRLKGNIDCPFMLELSSG
jgi:hypothetical protein